MTPEDKSCQFFQPAPTHGWSLETLKSYFDVRFDTSKESALAAGLAAEKAVSAALVAAALAVDKAEKQQSVYNAQQNEWRATITDLTGRVVDNARRDAENMVGSLSAKTEAAVSGVASKLADAVERLDRNDGRNTILAVLASALVAIVVGIAVAFLSGHFAVPVTRP